MEALEARQLMAADLAIDSQFAAPSATEYLEQSPTAVVASAPQTGCPSVALLNRSIIDWSDVTAPNANDNTLDSGENLLPGESVESSDGRFKLKLQGDGNLVLTYQPTGVALWHSGTHGQTVSQARMQTDGNFVLYNGSSPVWATNTDGESGSRLVVQNDGNVVIYATDGSAIWATNTDWADVDDDAHTLVFGEELLPGDSIRPENGRYSLALQGDGNLVLYDTAAASDLWAATALWATNTAGKNVSRAVMQVDGNFVLYDGADKVWATDTEGNNGAHLRIQDDGNVVIYAADGRAIWSTGTEGIPPLQSNPGAPHKLYLDFNGHYESTWTNVFKYNDVDTPRYDTDGLPGSLSDAEKWEIREIFERVAEDFAPFNVNVTTIDPGGYNGKDTTNTDNILRVAIGGSRNDWLTNDPNDNAIGVAYRGSYNNILKDNLVYIFSDNINSPEELALTISQEAGHAFGLHHQKDSGSPDRRNIMHGTAFLPSVDGRATWSRGENEKGKTQSDIAKLDDTLGRRPDREGNDFASAGELGVSAKYFDDYAVIGNGSDVDYFRFNVDSWSEATVSVNVLDVTALTGALNPGANLDARIELYKSSGELIVSWDDANDLSATVTETLSPGEYYVAVRSAGDYGDLGRYTVSATFVETIPPIFRHPLDRAFEDLVSVPTSDPVFTDVEVPLPGLGSTVAPNIGTATDVLQTRAADTVFEEMGSHTATSTNVALPATPSAKATNSSPAISNNSGSSSRAVGKVAEPLSSPFAKAISSPLRPALGRRF